MAHAYVPKPSLRSPDCEREKLLSHYLRAICLRRIVKRLNVCQYSPLSVLLFSSTQEECLKRGRMQNLNKGSILKASRSLFALVTIFVLFIFEIQAAALEIGGVIFAKVYQASDIINTSSNWFLVTIDGKDARIRAGPMGNPSIRDFEYGILENDSYLLIHYVTDLKVTEAYEFRDGNAVKVKLAVPLAAENSATITLNNGRVPEYDLGLISPVWMAYCFNLDSEHSETNHTQDSPIFSMGVSFRKLGGLADMAYTLNSSPPRMLQALVESAHSERFEKMKLPSPFPGRFTNLVYEVSIWTNVAGFALPQQFHATYHHVMGSSGIMNSLKVVFEGVATNFNANTPSLGGFRIPKVTRVVERRSALVNPLASFAYTTTNGVLLSREQLLQNKGYLRERLAMPELPRATQSYSKWRVVVIVALGLVTLLPLAIWLLISASSGSKTPD